MMDTSCETISNITLEDDAWKDSFEKLLEPRPNLRQLNILKKDVRTSFNMNSSVENCSNDSSKGINNSQTSRLSLPNSKPAQKYSRNERVSSISTPLGKKFVMNPFKCSLSPICDWKLRFCDNAEEPVRKKADEVNKFHATPINPEIIVADYETESLENIISKPSADFDKGVSKQLDIMEQNEKDVESKSKLKPKRKTSNRHVFFETIAENEKNKIENTTQRGSRKHSTPANTQRISTVFETDKGRPSSLTLQPGKWRKTLNVWRRMHNLDALNRKSSDVRFSKHNESVVIECVGSIGNRKSIFLNPDKELTSTNNCTDKSAWEKRVLKRCNQNIVFNFMDLYTQNQLQNCKKIGEGAYGEVFLNSFNEDPSQHIVLKIIPIEGQELINGEMQKTFEQILSEIAITLELGQLSNMLRSLNATSGFIGVKKVACVKGKYPAPMIQLWEEYDEIKGSENDHPDVFTDDQLYVILELSYGGKDLETFVFNNAEQSYYALQQIILTLAVGEESFQFEHRDLHWGNILLLNTVEKNVTYNLQGKTLTLPTKGVKTTIIDYTLSRMTLKDYCFYNDLSTDEELFSATGDYQFDVYRMMRDILKNNWEKFEPKTNVFWISYLNKKMIQGVSYKNTRTKAHSTYMSKLKRLDKIVLDFISAKDCAQYLRKIQI